MRTLTTILAAVLAVLPGCACDTVPSEALESCEATQVLPDSVETDILFVIDDSLSMRQEQANLSANLGAFIDALVASPVQNDFRIGVTTTSVEGFDASGQSYTDGPAAGFPYPDGAIVAVQTDASGNGIPGALVYDPALYPETSGWGGSRILQKSSPTLAQDFKANVLVGLTGSAKEQPSRAARLALSDRLLDANAGFLRDGARLAVIFVTDEDDCSDSTDPQAASNAQCHDDAVKGASPPTLDPAAEFGSFLLGPVGGELRDVVVGAIAGFDPDGLEPSCVDADNCGNTACATAFDGGDRFVELAFGVGGARMRLGSICDASFRDTLIQFAEILMPSALPLDGAPADYRMLVVTLTKAGAGTVPCVVAAEGTPEQAAADAIYSGPRLGRPAMVTFQNACRLDLGDRIDVRVVCAG